MLEVNSISDYLTVTTPLPQYLPYARFLLDTDLSHTAKLLYTLLLDRATLSQKNNWIDTQENAPPQIRSPADSIVANHVIIGRPGLYAKEETRFKGLKI